MRTFKQWLNEVGGTPWDAAPLQQPIDPEHPERSALLQGKIGSETDAEVTDDKPPCKRKFGKDRFLMKKKMKRN